MGFFAKRFAEQQIKLTLHKNSAEDNIQGWYDSLTETQKSAMTKMFEIMLKEGHEAVIQFVKDGEVARIIRILAANTYAGLVMQEVNKKAKPELN